jgi:hypothetical protein
MLEMDSLKSENKCHFCDIDFINIYTLRRHIKNTCKGKQNLVYRRNILLNELKNLNKQLEEAPHTVKNINSHNTTNTKNINSHNTTTNSNNTITNNITNVNLNCYGSENVSYLTKEDYLNFTKNKFSGIIEMIKQIHCNKDYKENFNMYIEHPSSKYMSVYNKDGWIDIPKADFLEQLKTDKFNQLDNYIFSLKTDISGNETDNDLHKKYQDIFNKFRDAWIDSDAGAKETKHYLDRINCTISSVRKDVSKIKKSSET